MFRGSTASAARPRRSVVSFSASIVLLGGLLVGCSALPWLSTSEPAPVVTSEPSPAAPGDGSETQASQPIPDGTAADNLPLFAQITAQVWASDQRSSGRAYIDALVEAGFLREHMQVTADVSTVGNPAESLQFSVAWGETECLIGQVGPSTGEPVTAVMPQLAEGRCLIGQTRPIDW
ncbi:DUF6993 domain-containing protein [Microbacterium esteraromaticum]|uniref:DUF6993 domain-containing protein n=1 Tax=Microbacterium esteraromaticum TaxID=57043 RepID=UPI001C9538FC|nr:hypothetical protein [Microbacterium esteraromaticum]MBY6061107.1 hypothetical protein [Microbacterium esteraromaticum]